MTKILVIKSSIREEESVSNALVDKTLSDMKESGDVEVIAEHNLAEMSLRHIDLDFLKKSGEDDLTVKFVDELNRADVLIMGCPMYNFGPSSYLKSYIDTITIYGKTFTYENGQPKGLLNPGKKLVICYASNGVPMNSPMDHLTPWLKTLFGFMGITEFEEKTSSS